jgi:DNA-directed RNA polymerase specialized sigma24 family protein
MTQRIGDRAINWLRTPIATLIVLIAALLAQLPHAADVFRMVVHGSGLWPVLHSYSYAIALELAVLLFVVQRRNVESYLFAAVSVCVNLAYYALHGVNLLSVAAIPAWLISIALPAAIARYSHLIVDAAQADAPATVAPTQDAPVQRRKRNAEPDLLGDLIADDVKRAQLAIAQDDATPVTDARAQALQMHAEGMNASQIAKALQINYSTVRSWLKRAQVQHTNGVQI